MRWNFMFPGSVPLRKLAAFVVLWFLARYIWGALDTGRYRRGLKMVSQVVFQNVSQKTEICFCRVLPNNTNNAKIIHGFFEARAPSGVPVWLQTSRRHPNLPIDILMSSQDRQHCGSLPFILNIKWLDIYWQIHTSNEGDDILLYSAHFDDRPYSESWPSVRVLALTRQETSVEVKYCQIWRNETKPPVAAPVLTQEYLNWEGKDYTSWNAILITCQIPEHFSSPSSTRSPTVDKEETEDSSSETDPPTAISLSPFPCEVPSNLLRLMGAPMTERQRRIRRTSALYPQLLKPSLTMENPREGAEGGSGNSGDADVIAAASIQLAAAAAAAHARAALAEKAFGNWEGYPWYKDMPPPSWERENEWGIGVCGPVLVYGNQKMATHLVNWAELLKTLGISKVFLYACDGDLHEKVMEVFKHYETEGFFQVTLFTFPSPYLSFPALKRLFTKTQEQKLIALENLYISDCILRNMRDFRFLVHLDAGEIPVLPVHTTLPDLIQELYTQTFRDRNGVIQMMPSSYTLHYSKSQMIFGGSPGKSIYDTLRSSGLNTRHRKTCDIGQCPEPVDIDLGRAFLSPLQECEGCRREAREEEMRKSVLPAVHKVLKELRLIGDT